MKSRRRELEVEFWRFFRRTTLFRLVRWELRRLGWALSFVLRGYPAVVVVSGGGAGTTTLITHLSKYVKTNSARDRDGLKHRLRVPRGRRGVPIPTVFVRTDPDSSMKSLERRGLVRMQAIKLGGWRALLLSSKRLDRFLRALLVKQLRIFEADPSPLLLIVDYPGFLEDPSKIEQFLELQDTSFSRDMPLLRPRRSGPAT